MTISRLKNDPYRGRAILFAALLACFLGFASLGSAETDLTVPAGALLIEDEAFMGDTSLTRVAAGEGLLRIESRAFAGCGLKEAQLPASVEYIAPDAFTGNGGLVISAPKGSYALRWAEDHGILFAFFGCGGFNSTLTIPDSVNDIGGWAFAGCSGFTGSLVIPGRVTGIGSFAFDGCTGLEKTVVQVTGPDGTVIMAERIAVYCPRGSYAWSWAENDDDLEPLEWDGVSRPGSPS